MKTFSQFKESCWRGYKQVGGKMKNGKMVPNCVPVKEAANPAQQAAIAIAMKKAGKKPKNLDEKNVPTSPDKWARAKAAAKAKFAVYPSAYANGWAAKKYKSMGGGWKSVNEDLRKWFREKWVRMDTKGNIKGDCAREPGEGKPKCLPQAKAHALGKKARAAAARKKRREDPDPDRRGKAIFVKTKVKGA